MSNPKQPLSHTLQNNIETDPVTLLHNFAGSEAPQLKPCKAMNLLQLVDVYIDIIQVFDK